MVPRRTGKDYVWDARGRLYVLQPADDVSRTTYTQAYSEARSLVASIIRRMM